MSPIDNICRAQGVQTVRAEGMNILQLAVHGGSKGR